MPASPKPTGDAAPPESAMRFDATIGGPERMTTVETVASMDLDRLPDLDGQVRALLTLDEIGALVESGHEVHIRAAVPIAPLDQSSILDDRAAQAWLEERVAGIPRKAGS